MTYCEYLNTVTGENLALHKEYHDNHYGFPVYDDDKLFERLMCEINQAGLNWILILKKQNNFRKAFDNYRVEKVAAYDDKDILRLMSDEGIISNRLKINAAIANASVILKIQRESGSFSNWLECHSATIMTLQEWTRLFKKTFKFTGGEIVNEFMMSIGYLPGAHSTDCPVYGKIIEIKRRNEKERQGSDRNKCD